MDTGISFGQYIKQERMTLGLTQAELARRVGCATITVRKIEADVLRPSVQIGERLALALDVPLEERADFVRMARAAVPDTPEPAPTPTPPPTAEEIGGEDLTGRAVRGYELAERIGEGGFGVVYRAVQPSVEREVAVKIILPRYANDPDFIRRFEAEAQLVARLEHPFIVPLYDYWREPNAAYLIMRMLRGGSLKDLLADGVLSLARVLPIVEQICQALNAAHRFGVIHRDLKPANILLDEDQNAYLADFGIAKNLGDPEMANHTQTGALIGSFAYLSPEQIRSESVLPQADIYALGVLLFQLLSGALPFEGPTPIDYIQQHLNTPLPSILDHNPSLPPAVDSVIRRATSKEADKRHPDVMAMLAEFRSAVDHPGAEIAFADTGLASIDPDEIKNPFKGLRPFGEADMEDFFGRETLIQELLGKLGDEADLARFLAVVGPSGSGKSSVVKAGLIPALRRGGLPGSEDWFVVDFLPGSHPFEELEAALLRVAVNPLGSLLEQLESGERGLVRAVRRVLPADEQVELVLVIDQFEELFTLVGDDGACAAFLEALVTAVMDPRSRLRVVITLRADFVDRPLADVDFGELMRERSTFVLPLTPDELEEAVMGPAQRVGLVPEPGLTARIVRELGDQPGILPLLQHTLAELYDHREGRRLTQKAYEATGGVLGSLALSAGEAFEKLDEGEQEAARQLFLRLVTLGEGVEDTRRRVLQSEFESLPAASELKHVIEAYGRARLLTFDRDPATRGPTVEVAHEALLREWSRLRDWLDESRADVRMQRMLARSAAEWRAGGKDASFLLRGVRLEQFEGWVGTTDVALTREERAYLDACLDEKRTREVAEAERQARGQALELRARNILRTLVGVFAVATIVAIFLTSFAFNERSNAVTSAATATHAQGEAQAQAATAVAAQAEAEAAQAESEAEARRADAAAAEAALQQSNAEESALEALDAFSASLAALAQEALNDQDSSTGLALALEAIRVIANQPPSQYALDTLVDAAFAPGPRRISTFEDELGNPVAVWAIVISPDRSYALIGLDDGRMIKIDPINGEVIDTYIYEGDFIGPNHFSSNETGSSVFNLAVSPDGRYALTGHTDGHVVYWDLVSGQVLQDMFGEPGPIFEVSFHPNGQMAVSGGGVGFQFEDQETPGQLILWDLQTGERIQDLEGGHDNAILGAQFTPDGRYVFSTQITATGLSNDPERMVLLWDLETGEYLQRFGEFGDQILFSAISSDSRTALIPEREKVFRVDLETGESLGALEGHQRSVMTVVLSENEDRALTTSIDGSVIYWDMNRFEPIYEFTASHLDHRTIYDVVFGPDDKTALTVADEGTLIIWDLLPAGEVGRYDGHDTPVVDLVMVPGGEQLLSGSGNIFPGQTEGVDNTIVLWDLLTGEASRVFEGHEDTVVAIDVSRDGRWILSVSYDGTMRMWNLETGEEVWTISDHPSSIIWDVAFHPDGEHAIVSYTGGITAYWDLNDKTHVLLEGHDGPVWGVTIHPDGERAFGISDRIVEWALATGEAVTSWSYPGFGGVVEVTLDGKYLYAGSGTETPTVWDLDTYELVTVLRGQQGNMGNNSVAIADDSRTAFIVSWNGTAFAWDLLTGEVIRRYPGHDGIATGAAISPDGTVGYSGGGDTVIVLWAITPPELGSLLEWIAENRIMREFTCEERELFRLDPFCEGG